MKKYSLFIVVFSFCIFEASAQDVKENTSRKTETTINGIPYSQYKAQQQALTAKGNTNATKPVGVDPTNSKVAASENKSSNPQKPNVLSPGENRKPIPVTNPVDVVKADETKTAATTITTPSSKGNGTVLKEQTTQPVNIKGTSLDPNGKPIETAPTVAVKEVKPVVSEVNTEKSTLPPVAVPVSAGSKNN